MKNILLNSVSALVLTVIALPAHADGLSFGESGGWYTSVFAGGSSLRNVETDYYGSAYSVDFNNGYVLGFAIGKQISPNLRVEGELSYNRNKASSYSYGGSGPYPADGHISATYLLANVWYDIPTQGKLKPYVGGGIGAARVNADTHFGGNAFGYGPGETKLAGQIGAGFSYELSPKMDLDVGYRYKVVNNVDFADNDGSGVYTAGDVQSHNLQIGLRIKLGK
jgi:opacity protein-like surface antigen